MSPGLSDVPEANAENQRNSSFQFAICTKESTGSSKNSILFQFTTHESAGLKRPRGSSLVFEDLYGM
jgi:hypothetical protein